LLVIHFKVGDTALEFLKQFVLALNGLRVCVLRNGVMASIIVRLFLTSFLIAGFLRLWLRLSALTELNVLILIL